MILEVGYVGTYAQICIRASTLATLPYMMKLGGQTFAQAYQNMYYALASGAKTVAPSPSLKRL